MELWSKLVGNLYTWYVAYFVKFFIQLHLLNALGAFPYPLLSNSDVLDILLNGQRLEKPPNCTEDL